MRRRLAACGALALLLCGCTAAAEPITQRTVDVTELLLDVHDHAREPMTWPPETTRPRVYAFGPWGGDSEDPVQRRRRERQRRLEALAERIRQQVAPESWAPAGARRIRPRDAQLEITQTAAGHAAIDRLIQRWWRHSPRSVQIAIGARLFIVAEPAGRLLADWLRRQDAPDGGLLAHPSHLLTGEQSAKLIERLRAADGVRADGYPRLMNFNGQRRWTHDATFVDYNYDVLAALNTNAREAPSRFGNWPRRVLLDAKT